MTKIDLCKQFIKDHCIIIDRPNYPVTNFYVNRINELYNSDVTNNSFISACNEIGINHITIKHKNKMNRTAYKSNLYALRLKHENI